MEAGFAKKRPPPQWYLECPGLCPGEEVYLYDFNELSTERQLGMSIGPIPASAIMRFADDRGFSGRSREVYRRVIRAMDSAYLDWVNKDASRNAKKVKHG